jgi:hypothetical protein
MKKIQIVLILVCLPTIQNLASADTWMERQMLTASDGTAGDAFGYSVSISGNYAIVGAPYDDNNGSRAGCVYILKWNGTLWAETQMLTASDGAAGDCFGWSVSISGDYAVVGAPYDDSNGSYSGSAYVFKRDGVLWIEQQKLTAPDVAANDCFGISVSIYADYIIVGAPYDDNKGSDSGSVYLFKQTGATWTWVQMLTASDGAAGDEFGYSVAISNDYAIVGAPYDDNNGTSSGSVYILKQDGVPWAETQMLTASDSAASDHFGNSVAISDDYAIVGAPDDDNNGTNSGCMYILKRNGLLWAETQMLTASDNAAGDEFGYSVSISGEYAVVGAPNDDNNGSYSGSVYIYKREGFLWNETQMLDASDGAAYDNFGWSVAIDTYTALTGAWYDDNNGSDSGSVYIIGFCPGADITGDCKVDLADFAEMAAWWLYGTD